MKQLATLLLVLVAFVSQAQTTCVDPLACNFTEFGECIYVDENGDLCVVEGCNIEGACNYDPEADLNDGSCDFESCLGCTDETACNFDPEALYLDNSCIYYIDCNGTCGGDWIQDECGNCYQTVQEEGLVEFTFTGAEQVFVVPSGVQEIQIECWGASGGNGHYGAPQQAGGLGGYAKGSLSVAPGEVLKLFVGGEGTRSNNSPISGGYNGGGDGYNYGNTSWNCAGGGGATDVRLGGSSLEDRVIVAGGGGGGGGSGSHGNGGGGDGGGLIGADGFDTIYGGYGPAPYGERHGKGGTQEAGGQGGSSQSPYGSAGVLGFGGDASTGNNTLASGGGGGYYGGGGGSYHGGGGGGGSSYIGGVTDGSTESGVNSGNGLIIVSWQAEQQPECELGCTTLQACNYNEDATNDDGTCDYCFCGPGTEYSVEAGQCLVVEGCTDFNDDGCTGTQDLLHLLSNFGNCDE